MKPKEVTSRSGVTMASGERFGRGGSKARRKEVRNRWQGFVLWISLVWYRFTRSVKSVFK